MPYINGIYMGAPGVVVQVNDSGFPQTASPSSSAVILLGSASDGQPQTPLNFNSESQATLALKGGPGLQAVLYAFQGGANNIYFIRPELATQGTLTINSPGTTPTAQLVLTTTSYGLPANTAKVLIQAGSPGYTISQGLDYIGDTGQTYPTVTGSNINLPVITLAYTGSDTNPTVTVTDSSLVVNATSGTTAVTVANISFTSNMTVQALVNQLNQITGLVATVVDPNPSDLVPALFDNVSAISLSTSSTAPTTLYGNITAVVRWFAASNAYFTAVRQPNATALATSATWQYATGGAAPSPTTTNWQNAYTVAEGIPNSPQEPSLLIGPVSSSPPIWAMNAAHCHYMASQGQPRRGYVGDASGQTIVTEIANAQALNDDRTTLVWPEQILQNDAGQYATIPPYLVASKIMGMRSTYPFQNALTMQPIGSNGEGQPVTQSVVAQGLAGGVCVLGLNQNGQVIVSQDRTTWLTNSAYDKVENSTGLTIDLIILSVNSLLQKFTGQAGSATTLGIMANETLALLQSFFGKNLLTKAPQLSDITLTLNGNVVTGNIKLYAPVPQDYILITIQPVALSLSA